MLTLFSFELAVASPPARLVMICMNTQTFTNAYILSETRHICRSELVGAPFGTSRTWDENEVART
jgi:hypothetical protein